MIEVSKELVWGDVNLLFIANPAKINNNLLLKKVAR